MLLELLYSAFSDLKIGSYGGIKFVFSLGCFLCYLKMFLNAAVKSDRDRIGPASPGWNMSSTPFSYLSRSGRVAAFE